MFVCMEYIGFRVVKGPGLGFSKPDLQHMWARPRVFQAVPSTYVGWARLGKAVKGFALARPLPTLPLQAKAQPPNGPRILV